MSGWRYVAGVRAVNGLTVSGNKENKLTEMREMGFAYISTEISTYKDTDYDGTVNFYVNVT